MKSYSIVIGLSDWLTLILEVFGVVLLGVPLVIWIRDIKAPAHHLTVSNSWICRREFYLKVISLWVKSILRWRTPLHQATFEGVLSWEINNPILTKHFVLWVAMNVLPLWHVNSSNSVLELSKVSLEIRRHSGTSTAEDTWLWPLSETDFVWVGKIWQVIKVWLNSASLDSTIDKLWTIWWRSWRSSIYVILQSALKCGDGFTFSGFDESWDGFIGAHYILINLYLINNYK